MLRYRNIIIIFLISLLTVAGLFMLTDIYLNIRFNELKLYLQESDRRESSIDHIQLIKKYSISKMLYRDKIALDAADALESRIDMLASEKTAYETIFFGKYKLLSVPALFIINLNRFFLGKEPIRFVEEDGTSGLLDEAYYFERNNIYRRAIEKYGQLLEMGGLERAIAGSVRLHQGFCFAVIGAFGEAERHYNKVIDDFPGEGIALTASILLGYLNEFSTEQAAVSGEPDSLAKAERLFSLFAYNKALSILDSLEGSASGEKKILINYYKARCCDELGMKEKAVNAYLAIITASPDSIYAKLANRRLYICGQRLGDGIGIKKIAININTKIPDEILGSMITFDDAFKSGALSDEIIKNIRIKDELLAKVEKIPSRGSAHFSGRSVIVSTSDGSIFIGMVVESDALSITLQSAVGRVKLERSRILNIKILND